MSERALLPAGTRIEWDRIRAVVVEDKGESLIVKSEFEPDVCVVWRWNCEGIPCTVTNMSDFNIWWEAHWKGKLGLPPLENSFREVAEKAWNAAKGE